MRCAAEDSYPSLLLFRPFTSATMSSCAFLTAIHVAAGRHPPVHSLPHLRSSTPRASTGRPQPASPGPTLKKPPILWRIPFVGLARDVAAHGSRFGERNARLHGPVYRTELLGDLNATIVADHALINAGLSDDAISSADVFPSFRYIFGEDVIFSLDGRDHAAERSRLSPLFARSLFPFYLRDFLGRARGFWGAFAEKVRGGDSVRVVDELKPFLFAYFVELTAGITDGIDELSQLYTSMSVGLFAPRVPWGKWPVALASRDKIYAIVSTKIENILKDDADVIARLRALGLDDGVDKREGSIASRAREELKDGRVNILTVMLAQTELEALGEGFTSSTLRSARVARLARSIVLLWFAAAGNTANSVLSCVHELCRNHDVLSDLRSEQRSLGQRATLDDVLANERMPLLTNFVYEVIRLRPMAPSIWRRAAAEGTSLGGFKIAPRSLVVFDVATAMRDKSVFGPNADNIDLRRYQPGSEASTTVRRNSTLGFGSGIHKCVGGALSLSVIKGLVAVIVAEWDLEIEDGASQEYSYFPAHRPESGVPVSAMKKLKI